MFPRLFAAYEEETESTTEIVQILEYISGGQLFEKIIESPYSKCGVWQLMFSLFKYEKSEYQNNIW